MRKPTTIYKVHCKALWASVVSAGDLVDCHVYAESVISLQGRISKVARMAIQANQDCGKELFGPDYTPTEHEQAAIEYLTSFL